ncbi:hypothetical protein Gohar_026693, partial [Gossypium harknessii]|nr:hypothetical protein [Gossypium harknessii]
RNKLIHEKNVILPHDIIYKVESYIREVDELQRKLPTRRVDSERWRPLEFPFHKLNFDAAFNRYGKCSCTRIVVRNWEGRVVVSNIVINNNIPNSFAVKAIACLQVVNLERDLGFQEVLIEGDALSMIKKMQACDIDDSLVRAYIYDGKHKPGGSNRCDFHHIQRNANRVTDILAKEGLKRGKSTYLVGFVPLFAKHTAENDRCRRRSGDTESHDDVPLRLP